MCVVEKVGHTLDRLGARRISEVWIDNPALVAAWIEACPGSIGGGEGERASKGFTKSPQTWHYPPQHRITTHYIECDKDPPWYGQNPDNGVSILLFPKYKTSTQEKNMHLCWIAPFDSMITCFRSRGR